MKDDILNKYDEYKPDDDEDEIIYTEGEIGRYKIIEDFLPSPAEFAAARKKSRITLNLKEPTVEFFKKEAEKNNIPYQVLIRDLLEKYVEKHERK